MHTLPAFQHCMTHHTPLECRAAWVPGTGLVSAQEGPWLADPFCSTLLHMAFRLHLCNRPHLAMPGGGGGGGIYSVTLSELLLWALFLPFHPVTWPVLQVFSKQGQALPPKLDVPPAEARQEVSLILHTWGLMSQANVRRSFLERCWGSSLFSQIWSIY